MTYTYESPKRPRKCPLRAALGDRLYDLGDWHTDGFLAVRGKCPEGALEVTEERRAELLKLLTGIVREKRKTCTPARFLVEFTASPNAWPREPKGARLLVAEAHYHTGPILLRREKVDYIMALYPTAELLTERRSTSVAFRVGKKIVAVLQDIQYAEPGDISHEMQVALKTAEAAP